MPTNPFALSPYDAQHLVDKLLDGEDTDGAQYTTHVVESLEPAAPLGPSVTGAVFEGSFDNSPALLLDEYAEYLASMLHIVVCDVERRIPVGSIGLIRTPVAQLKTVVDLTQAPWRSPVATTAMEIGTDLEAKDCWDIATFAVLPEYRRTKVAIAMLHAGFLASRTAGITRWTAILDDAVLRGVNALTRRLFSPIGPATSVPYLGSAASTAVTAPVPDDVMADPSLSWVSGRGLEPSFSFVGRARTMRTELHHLTGATSPASAMVGV